MNWEQIEGSWAELKGKAKQKWGKLTDDELEAAGGKKEELLGQIRRRYGITREGAEKQLDEFLKAFK